MDERLFWTGEHGQLAKALGISQHTTDRVEVICGDILSRNGTIREILDALEELDLTFNEWTASIFALGHFYGTFEAGMPNG